MCVGLVGGKKVLRLVGGMSRLGLVSSGLGLVGVRRVVKSSRG